MEIRKAKQEDAERIIDINIEVWNTTYKNLISQEIIDKLQYKNKERIDKSKKRIKEKNNTYVALVNGEIVGFSTYGRSRNNNYPNAGEIYAEYILEGYQGLGIGRKLAIMCMQELLNEGYTELVTACLNGNPSNEFHKSLGGILVEQSEFEPLGIHVGTENVYFHKNLRKSLEYNASKKI